MKKSLSDLIKGVIASSVAAIAGTHGADAAPAYTFKDAQSDATKEANAEVKKDLSYKLLLTMNADESYMLSGHRSHSSHSSHRSHSSGSSHYSHSSHSSSSHYSSSHYSSSTTTATKPSTSSSSSSSSIMSTYKSSGSYTIGDRPIKKDLYGSDVKTASDYLVKLGYLNEDKISKNSSGYVVCDDAFVEAISSFEKDNSMAVDGALSILELSTLKSIAAEFKNLGDRELTVGMKGTDVAQMKNLLIEKKYIEAEPVKVAILFDDELLGYLNRFLEDIGLDWEGKVDSQMVYFLKKKYDE